MALKRRKQSAKRSTDGQPTALQAIVSIESPEEECAGKPSQGLKFVDVTPRYLQGTRNLAEQKGIRVHVMQNFLRQKKQPVDAIEPPTMAGTVSSHVHRFRIAKSRLLGDKPVGTVSSQKVAICSEQSRRNTPPRTSSTTVRSSWDLPESEKVVPASADQPIQRGTLLTEERASPLPPRISPILPGVMARMDPFTRFPIDTSVETHGILDYYRTSYWSNSLAVNPDGKWLSIAATDPALFHAQLSLVTQHQALRRGTSFPELHYYHRGMAISIVTSRLVHPVEAISDQTIGAVALLSNSDNYFDVPPGVEHSHINGLLSLVQLRGGLHTLSTNENVKRVVTWADLVHAASNNCIPRLGVSQCNAGYGLKHLFPDSASAASLVRMIYPEQPPVPAPLKEVFETIRLLSIAQSSPDLVDLNSMVNRRILANVIYRVEYSLLDPRFLTLGVSECQEGSTQLDYPDIGKPLFSATTAGALIFTYSCLRDLAIPSRPFERLVRRLRLNLQVVLDEEKSTNASSEQDCPSLGQHGDSQTPGNVKPSLLLWLLIHGFKATVGGARGRDREWFVRRGAETCKNLEIQSGEELRMQIKKVVTSGPRWVPATKAFWKAICDHQETGQESSD